MHAWTKGCIGVDMNNLCGFIVKCVNFGFFDGTSSYTCLMHVAIIIIMHLSKFAPPTGTIRGL